MEDPSTIPEVVRHGDAAAERIQFLFKRFLEEFSLSPEAAQEASQRERKLAAVHSGFSGREVASDGRVYMVQMLNLRGLGATTLYVDMRHLDAYNEVLATAVVRNYYRFEGALRKAIQLAVSEIDPGYAKESRATGSGASAADAPLKEFWIALHGLPSRFKIRDLTTEKLGVLLTISGTVTRTSEVRPELLYGAFMCTACGRQVAGVEQQFKFTHPERCVNPECQSKGGASSWQLQIESSRFVDWQKVTLQEHSNEIPSGSMPRSLEIILRNDQVEKARAGDTCLFTGCLVVIPDVAQLRIPGASVRSMREASSQSGFPRGAGAGLTGLAELGVKDLTYRLAFLGSSVQRIESRFGVASVNDGEESEEPVFTDEEMEEVLRLKGDPLIYKKLANSIAPSIFGHEEVKRGILLMLFGGVHKTTMEGINIRGDINVCIVGDPSMSKSQFLKYVVNFMPRAVYTSGKASSAAGLTATVARDPETGDYNIEAGALMLADNGVCCIDEFDKMDVKDQVAIHEAMEQQTISIAKAGIKATLNARTSILAAANPLSGRYDKTKTLRGNLSIGAAIMSRFDLFFIVVDESDEAIDRRIADHILGVHQRQAQPVDLPLTADQLSRYMRYARYIKPQISDESARLLVDNYRSLRQNDVSSSGKTSYRITVRQLESMIRLSEALARVHCDPIVQPRYVTEAARLLKKSIINVETEDISFEDSLHLKSLKDDQGNIDIDDDDDDDDDDDGIPDDVQDQTVDQRSTLSDDLPVPHPQSTSFSQSHSSSQSHSTLQLDSQPQSQSSSQPPAPRRKLRISFEEYKRVSNLLVVTLRLHERITEEGMTQSELIDEYLRQEHISDRTELAHLTRLLREVVQRLITKDGVLIVTVETDDPQERVLRSNVDYDPYD